MRELRKKCWQEKVQIRNIYNLRDVSRFVEPYKTRILYPNIRVEVPGISHMKKNMRLKYLPLNGVYVRNCLEHNRHFYRAYDRFFDIIPTYYDRKKIIIPIIVIGIMPVGIMTRHRRLRMGDRLQNVGIKQNSLSDCISF